MEQGEPETKSERVGVAVTPTELQALQAIAALYPETYDGASSVLRDYSLRDAVTKAQDVTTRLKQLTA